MVNSTATIRVGSDEVKVAKVAVRASIIGAFLRFSYGIRSIQHGLMMMTCV